MSERYCVVCKDPPVKLEPDFELRGRYHEIVGLRCPKCGLRYTKFTGEEAKR